MPSRVESQAPSSFPSAGPAFTPLRTIADIVVAEDEFATLEVALEQANLLSTLNGTTRLTLFAPNNQAFDNLDPDFLNSLLTDDGFFVHLVQLLLYHVAFGDLMAEDLFNGRQILTLSLGELLVVFVDSGDILLNTTAVLEQIPGATPARILTRDIVATNGVVHEMEDLLLPDFAFTDLIDVLESSPARFSTFMQLVMTTDLEGFIRGGTFMVLAPNNDAFSDLPQDVLDFLLDPNNVSTLRIVLLYHVSPEVYSSIQLQDLTEVPTVQGTTVEVRAEFEPITGVLLAIFFNDVAGLTFNLLANNGIIHELQGVLSPIELPPP